MQGRSKIIRLGRSANIHVPAFILSDEACPIPRDATYVFIQVRKDGLLIKAVEEPLQKRHVARSTTMVGSA